MFRKIDSNVLEKKFYFCIQWMHALLLFSTSTSQLLRKIAECFWHLFEKRVLLSLFMLDIWCWCWRAWETRRSCGFGKLLCKVNEKQPFYHKFSLKEHALLRRTREQLHEAEKGNKSASLTKTGAFWNFKVIWVFSDFLFLQQYF